MNTESQWFRERMILCAREHQRVWKTWTRMILVGWVFILLDVTCAVTLALSNSWSCIMPIIAGTFVGFVLKDTYRHRRQLCESWLAQRDLYEQEYDKRK
jgi:hypothetical protein